MADIKGNLTPKSKTNSELRKDGVSPNPEVMKKKKCWKK